MTEAEALRVLGLGAIGRPELESPGAMPSGGTDGAADAEAIRNAFSAQMRMLRSARSEAHGARERERIDRALMLTLLARDRLLPADSRAFAVTQEMARIERPRLSRHAFVVLLIGALMVVLGLLPDPDPVVVDGQDEASVAASSPAPSPVKELRVSRTLLENLRLALQAQWQLLPSSRLPAATDFGTLALPPLPAGWRWQAQRDGAFAAVDAAGADWLLAAPLLENGSLYWACFSARPGRDGCHVIAADRILERRLPRGQVGARLLAEALARLPQSQLRDGWSPERWYRQALRQGEPEAAMALADLAAAAAQPAADVADYLGQAVTLFSEREAFAEAIAAVLRLVDLRLAAGMPHADTLALLERCTALREQRTLSCPDASAVGRQLELQASSDADWDDVRWWYEQGMQGQQQAALEGMVRLLAMGRVGAVQRRRALLLLEEAAEGWSAYSGREAGRVAANLVRIWSSGWGVEADQGEASWWASQGARLGNVGAALHLGAAFALGLGTARDMDRAREVVNIYADHAPIFDVAFHREVARRLETGDGVAVDQEGAAAWYRRAFDICQQLAAAGDSDARFDLAGMYFSGHGVERDLAEAVRLYAELLEVAPQAARNMLAWIRATAPDADLRDGGEALAMARELVNDAPTPTYLDTLAAALAETGAYAEAVSTQQRALDMLESTALPMAAGADVADRRERLAMRLAQYRQRRPWRDDGLG